MLRTKGVDMEPALDKTHLHMKKQELVEHMLDLLGVEASEGLAAYHPRKMIGWGLKKMTRIDLVNLCSALKVRLSQPTQTGLQPLVVSYTTNNTTIAHRILSLKKSQCTEPT